MATVINKSVGPIGYGLMGKSNHFAVSTDIKELCNKFTDSLPVRLHLAT